jgi:hypothetical protein
VRVGVLIILAAVISATAALVWRLSTAPLELEPAPATARIDTEPPPAAPPPVRAAPAAAVVVAPAPLAVVAVPDAADSHHLVRFTVYEGLKKAAGLRLTLRCGKEEVDGLVDIMGVATVLVPAGDCRVLTSRAQDESLHLDESTTSAEVHLLDAQTMLVRGRVFEKRFIPAARAKVNVEWRGREGLGSRTTVTENDGTFSIPVPATRAVVWASTPSARSRLAPVEGTDPEAVTLEVEATSALSVNVSGPGAQDALLVVKDGVDTQVAQGSSPLTFDVLRGQVRVAASAMVGGRLFSANADETVEALTHRVKLKLKPAPPLTGRVLDPTGAPLRGVTVQVRPLGYGAEDFIRIFKGPELPPIGEVTSTISLEDGSFSLEWPAQATVFTVELTGQWQLDKPQLVVAGDKPLELHGVPK